MGDSDGDIPYAFGFMSWKLTKEVWLEVRIGRHCHISGLCDLSKVRYPFEDLKNTKLTLLRKNCTKIYVHRICLALLDYVHSITFRTLGNII